MKVSAGERTGRLRKRGRDGGICSVRVGKSRDLSLTSLNKYFHSPRKINWVLLGVALDS